MTLAQELKVKGVILDELLRIKNMRKGDTLFHVDLNELIMLSFSAIQSLISLAALAITYKQWKLQEKECCKKLIDINYPIDMTIGDAKNMIIIVLNTIRVAPPQNDEDDTKGDKDE